MLGGYRLKLMAVEVAGLKQSMGWVVLGMWIFGLRGYMGNRQLKVGYLKYC